MSLKFQPLYEQVADERLAQIYAGVPVMGATPAVWQPSGSPQQFGGSQLNGFEPLMMYRAFRAMQPPQQTYAPPEVAGSQAPAQGVK